MWGRRPGNGCLVALPWLICVPMLAALGRQTNIGGRGTLIRFNQTLSREGSDPLVKTKLPKVAASLKFKLLEPDEDLPCPAISKKKTSLYKVNECIKGLNALVDDVNAAGEEGDSSAIASRIQTAWSGTESIYLNIQSLGREMKQATGLGKFAKHLKLPKLLAVMSKLLDLKIELSSLVQTKSIKLIDTGKSAGEESNELKQIFGGSVVEAHNGQPYKWLRRLDYYPESKVPKDLTNLESLHKDIKAGQQGSTRLYRSGKNHS
eukprot:jgi/Bigna1/143024/aug1.75_g17732